MGSTFFTLQIRNSWQLKPEEFKKLMSIYFQRKGLVPATEDDAQVSYLIAFSEKSDWVGLSTSEYHEGLKQHNTDAEAIAKLLRTHCVTASVWDSDFMEVELYGSTAKKRDSVVVGRTLADGFPAPKGEKKLWASVLAEGKTWEQLSEVFNGENTFVEDSLAEMASVLGMDEEIAVRDYDGLAGANTNAFSVVDLHLKPASAKPAGKKAVSLNTAFKQIFGEALEPLGFVKIKGRQPYFVRLIGDEIIHVVAYQNERSNYNDYKAFNILGGVATVYRQRIDLETSPMDNNNWIYGNLHFYRKSNPLDETPKYSFDDLYTFYYNEETIAKAVKLTLKITKDVMLPVFDKVVDIDSCIEYSYKFGPFMRLYDDSDDFGNKRLGNAHNEGFLLIKVDNYGEKYTRFNGENVSVADARNEFFGDPELYAKCMAELKRRKEANIEILRSYGLDL